MFLIHSKNTGFNIQAFDVVFMSLFFVAGTYGIKGIANYMGLGALEDTFSLLFYIWWAIVYLHFLWSNKHMCKDLIIAETFYIGILYLNYRLYPASQEFYEEYMMQLRQIAVVFIPTMTVAFRINNFKGSVVLLGKYGKYGIGFMILCYFMGYIQRWDYQFYGIHLCPFVLMVYAQYVFTQNRKDLWWCAVGFIFLMAGGRQSFVGFFMGIVILYYSEKLSTISFKRFVALLFISVFVLFFIYLLTPFLLNIVSDILGALGMESRTLEMLNSSELTSTSSRDDIYEMSVYFVQRTTGITGLFADRVMLRNLNAWMAYPHNLVLELMIDFGMAIGGLISAYILGLFAVRLYKGNLEKKLMIGVVGTAILSRLMVSSSFMIEGPFYLMLGLLLNAKDDIISKKTNSRIPKTCE